MMYLIINIEKYKLPSDYMDQLNRRAREGWRVSFATTTYFMLEKPIL